MLHAGVPRICWCSENGSVHAVQSLLEEAKYEVCALPLAGTAFETLERSNLIIIDEAAQSTSALSYCKRLRHQLGDAFIPILYVTADADPATRLASLEHGADAYLLRPFESAELLAQIKALTRIKSRHDRLVEKSVEVQRINQQLQRAYQQIDRELALAGRIQLSFLPQQLPELPQVRMAVHYRPCGQVGGDFYDVFRLDENHFGLYIADAMGHGVPASLLTIFVKKGIFAKEITGHHYRLVPPSEVLGRLNRDLIEQDLSDNPFITMVYALFNYREGTFQFARAGHPYPIFIPRDEEPQLWRVEGTLLGVFDTEYKMETAQLRPGDRVLLYTDGVDSARRSEESDGVPHLLRCVNDSRDVPLDELVEKVGTELFDHSPQNDDVTLLALEMVE